MLFHEKGLHDLTEDVLMQFRYSFADEKQDRIKL